VGCPGEVELVDAESEGQGEQGVEVRGAWDPHWHHEAVYCCWEMKKGRMRPTGQLDEKSSPRG
jgi:hypothetical protein